MNKGIITLFILIACSWVTISRAISPVDINVPARPEFLAVNVDTATGNAVLQWKHNTETDIIYHIFKYNGAGDPVLYDSVYQKPLNNYYIDKDAHPTKGSEAYLVHVIEDPDGSRISSKQYSISLSTLLLKVSFDSCQAKSTIQWSTKLSLWAGETGSFTIFRKTGNAPASPIGEVDGNTYKYTDGGLLAGIQYTYFIQAKKKNDTLEIFSNKSSIFSKMSSKPNYLAPTKTSVKESGFLDVSFAIDPSGETNKYILTRSNDANGNYDTIQEFITNEKTITYPDIDVNGNENVYYYKLQAINYCNSVFLESPPINNVLLSANEDNLGINLNWTPFLPAKAGDFYTVYREKPGFSTSIIYPGNEYDDNIDDLKWKNHDGQFCYYIETSYFDTNLEKTFTSISNSTCVSLETGIIKMANALNPRSNVSELNKIFKPFLTFQPEKYFFVVYDRWGRKMFETNNPLEGWEGKTLSGKEAPEGVYVYEIKITSFNGETKKIPGTVTLVYH